MSTRLEQVLAPEFVEGLTALSIEEVRARRAECQAIETEVSFLRRLTQGRLDILVADLQRRVDGGRTEVSSLLDQLGGILAESLRGQGSPGRLPTPLAPERTDDLTDELDAMLPTASFADLVQLDDAEVLQLGERLRDYERRMSAQRRLLHERIDAFEQEIVRRYKAREVSVDSLLQENA